MDFNSGSYPLKETSWHLCPVWKPKRTARYGFEPNVSGVNIGKDYRLPFCRPAIGADFERKFAQFRETDLYRERPQTYHCDIIQTTHTHASVHQQYTNINTGPHFLSLNLIYRLLTRCCNLLWRFVTIVLRIIIIYIEKLTKKNRIWYRSWWTTNISAPSSRTTHVQHHQLPRFANKPDTCISTHKQYTKAIHTMHTQKTRRCTNHKRYTFVTRCYARKHMYTSLGKDYMNTEATK